MENKNQKIFTKILFIIYFIVLTWIIVFKMQINIYEISQTQYRNINLIPFQSSVVTNGKINLSEIIWNILIFVPFGIYVSMWNDISFGHSAASFDNETKKWSFLKKTAPVFLTSLAYETIQYIFAIGASDITNLIGNTLGGILGILLFWLLSKVLKENTIKTVNILAAVGTVLILILIAVILIANI